MDRNTAADFVYAKACGMYSKSFVGKRTQKLFEVRSISELCNLVLDEDVPLLPEAQLAEHLEEKVTQNLVRDFMKLLSAYSKPDPLSLALISKYDFANLKVASHEVLHNRTDNSFLIDISPYSIFNWKKWPDLNEVVKGSCISPHLIPTKGASVEDIQNWDSNLDRIYYQSIWDGLNALPAQDRKACEKLVREEMILQNLVWILRLRTYFNLRTKDIKPLLLNIQDEKTGEPVCKPAYFAFDKPLDEWALWKDWEFAWLLNPSEEGMPWILDPRWVEFSAQKYVYKLARKMFRESAFTVGILVSFFKIKQLEEYMIHFAAENLRVGSDNSFKSEFFGDRLNA